MFYWQTSFRCISLTNKTIEYEQYNYINISQFVGIYSYVWVTTFNSKYQFYINVE